jgi:PAS domain S-box-containing protein
LESRVPEQFPIESLPANRRLELLVHAVVDYALFLLSPDGRVVSWNPGAERLKGYSESEIVGQPLATFFTAEDQAKGIPTHALEIAGRDGRYESEGWRVRKDGTKFWAGGGRTKAAGSSGTARSFAKDGSRGSAKRRHCARL